VVAEVAWAWDDPECAPLERKQTAHVDVPESGLEVVDQLAVLLAKHPGADEVMLHFRVQGKEVTLQVGERFDGRVVKTTTFGAFVNILPGTHPGDKAFVSLTPFSGYYTIDNRVMTTPAGTGRKLYINREPGSTVLTLWGSMPMDDAGANEGLAIEDPAEFAASLFRHLLEVRGIAIYGKQRTRHTELASLSTFTTVVVASGRGGDEHSLTSPAGPLVLAEYQSPPLSEDIQVINKVSQNLHAEILLRLLGREKGTGGTVQAGLEVLRGFLNNAGIASDDYAFYDGSGLSRENLVTPHAAVELLRYASTQPWGKEFRDSLPAAGVDGSLADRCKDLDPGTRVYAKTGSLGGVKTLSGYAITARGEQVAFSILTNNFSLPGKQVNDVIDRVIQAAVNSPAK